MDPIWPELLRVPHEGYEASAKLDMTFPVPLQIRNAPTKLIEELGYANNLDFSSNNKQVHTCDLSSKITDEGTLRAWEEEETDRKRWDGQSSIIS